MCTACQLFELAKHEYVTLDRPCTEDLAWARHWIATITVPIMRDSRGSVREQQQQQQQNVSAVGSHQSATQTMCKSYFPKWRIIPVELSCNPHTCSTTRISKMQIHLQSNNANVSPHAWTLFIQCCCKRKCGYHKKHPSNQSSPCRTDSSHQTPKTVQHAA